MLPDNMRPKYRGPNMTMDFSNAEVTNVLRLIGDVSNLNIIWGPDVRGSVSIRLKNVPWEQALDLILMNNNLGRIEEGNIVWIAPKSQIDQIKKEEQERREAKLVEIRRLEEDKIVAEQAKKEVEPLITEYLRIDFADAEKDIIPLIEPWLTERGRVIPDKRTNTIIVTDIASSLQIIKNIVSNFDVPVEHTSPGNYVNPDRIHELTEIKDTRFDLTKLLRLCKDLNICSQHGALLAVPMIVRGIIDHVPPIFEKEKFSEVANNYNGSKSFKASMQHLHNSSRNIADSYLHTQIRSKEAMPTETQINFKNDLDVLLQEIVRILGKS